MQDLPPFHFAASLGHSRIIRTLLAAGADPSLADVEGWVPLHFAAAAGNVAAARLLLDAAPQTALAASAEEGIAPCHLAVHSSAAAVVRLILDAAPQAALMKTRYGGTLLHMAAQNGQDKAVSERPCNGALPRATGRRSA